MRKLMIAVLLTLAAAARAADTPLEAGFRNPPAAAKPQTWWHWVNGNVTKEGITADLEAMQRIGLGGAEIFNVDVGLPAGPARFMSPQWHQLMAHAIREADRLGLQLCMHNCAGWSSSGGPWVTPEHAMQVVTTSEIGLHGPARFDDALPQPPSRLDFYRDIAVLAFRTPPAEQTTMAAAAPKVTASGEVPNLSALTDALRGASVALPAPRDGAPAWVQLEFAHPFTARTLRLVLGPGRNAASGELRASDDGTAWRTVRGFSIPAKPEHGPELEFTFPATTARFWRLAFSRATAPSRRINLTELTLGGGLRIADLNGKAAVVRGNGRSGEAPDTPADEDAVVPREGITDLTSKLQPNGRLYWDVPAGDWTVVRFGYTPTGATNEPAAPEARGPEVDKLSREALDAHWAAAVAPVLRDAGPLAGKSFNDVLIDSYEVGSQNWTPRFREEFTARRGYDPLPWLPVLTGRVVGGAGQSERFLWDVRRTVADLFAANYYGHMAELAHQNGLLFSTEPYGNGTFDELQCGATPDIPMGEFWVGGGAAESCKLAASAGHTNGRPIIGAESFTADDQLARWQNSPYSLKALGDRMYCAGINRFIFHRYAMQPWIGVQPGMTMGPWGIHFERTETWWDQSAAWMKYLARCQFLLQQGHFVADVLSFNGEDAPNSLRAPAGLPPGYDYDGCSADVLMKRLSVKDGRLTLPDGASYRLLVLPDSDTMTPALLRRLTELVRQGAVVLGRKPTHSPSLQDYPACDEEVRRLADELWGTGDMAKPGEQVVGVGRVIWGQPVGDVLTSLQTPPDVQVHAAPDAQIRWIHRSVGDSDIYFVANGLPRVEETTCTFRSPGKLPGTWVPHMWRADAGVTEPCALWSEKQSGVEVPLRLGPAESCFVVFGPGFVFKHLMTVTRTGPPMPRPKPAEIQIVKAEYGVLNAEADGWVDVTAPVKALLAAGTRRITASNTLAGDPASNVVKEMCVEYEVGGQRQSKTVAENQTVDVPEGATVTRALYGLLPDETAPPPTDTVMDLTAIVAAQVKDGELHIVTGNELAGRDPVPQTPKQTRIEYVVNGTHHQVTLGENQRLDLPEGSDVAAPLPAYTIATDDQGRGAVVAWAPGNITLAAHIGGLGGVNQKIVPAVPAPLELSGPWQVSFPPNLGAPPQAVFPKLISWGDSADPGIKYFSGTAAYRTTVQVPAGLIAPTRRFLLDLGSVQVIADATLNGKPLGTLWKPPFTADVTGVLHPGANTLEVRVANLWVNRLIGDEQYPDDARYTAGGAIAEWPAWLLNHQPRLEPRRIAFSAWKHWHKDDPLLPSGLIGPVRIVVGEAVPVP